MATTSHRPSLPRRWFRHSQAPPISMTVFTAPCSPNPESTSAASSSVHLRSTSRSSASSPDCEKCERLVVPLPPLVGGRADPLAAHERQLAVVQQVEVERRLRLGAEAGEGDDACPRARQRSSPSRMAAVLPRATMTTSAPEPTDHSETADGQCFGLDDGLCAELTGEHLAPLERLDDEDPTAGSGRDGDELQPHDPGTDDDDPFTRARSAPGRPRRAGSPRAAPRTRPVPTGRSEPEPNSAAGPLRRRRW